MTKLVDQFGTKYFAAHYAGEVKKFLSTAKQVDLAGARICRDVMKHVSSAAYEGVEIHDTEDPEREAYFEENRRRRELQKSNPTPVPLPIPSSSDEVIRLIKALDPNKLYGISDGRLVSNQAFVCLVQAARPEIKIDLGSYVGEVMALVYNNLFPSSHRWDEFYVLVGTTFVVQRPTPGEYSNFINEHIAIPSVFGKECLFKLPEWDRCIGRISHLLEKSMKPKSRKIKDYL